MKAAFIAAAAALVGSAMADGHLRRHNHEALHHKRAPQMSSAASVPSADATCGCTTKVITITGSPTLVPISSTPTPSSTPCTTTVQSTSYTTVTVEVSPTSSSTCTVPTPGLSSFSSTGTYTIPATTLTVTDTTTVCAATTAPVTSGTNTVGGVTTVVETETTVVCPYATTKPSGTTVTSVIETTTYVCPSAGTYTIAPITTYVSKSTVLVVPTPSTITPGTYTKPEQVVTVTDIETTYYCPFSNAAQPTSSAAAPPPPPASSASSPAPAPVASTTSVPALLPIPTPAAAGSGPVSGPHYGMTYTPYSNSGGCKSQSDILSDVAAIAQRGFSVIRVYSTDCNTLEYVGQSAAAHGLKMIVGVFISATGVTGAQPQVEAIASWARWDLVDLIVVGNEAISDGYTDVSTLAGFISSAKSAFRSAGYSGPVTTTEPLDIWQAHGSGLCGAIDVVGANIHPFFNAQTTPEQAGPFIEEEFNALSSVCPGKEMINLETGWPSCGSANGAAIPGPVQQLIALQSIANSVGHKCVFFSDQNDLWKQPGEFGVEQCWGSIDAF